MSETVCHQKIYLWELEARSCPSRQVPACRVTGGNDRIEVQAVLPFNAAQIVNAVRNVEECGWPASAVSKATVFE
jgi:hypothetical protein